MQLLHTLRALLNRREKVLFVATFGLTAVGSAVETISVAALPAYVALLTAPDATMAMVRKHLPALAGTPPDKIILGATIILGLFFLAKNGYLAAVAFVQRNTLAKVQHNVSVRLLASYLHSPYTFHLRRNSADLMRRIGPEISQLFLGVLVPLLVLLSESLVVLLIAVLLLAVEPISSVLAITVIGGTTFLFYRSIRKALASLGEVEKRHGSEMYKWVAQSLGGVKEAKVLGREQFFIEAYREHLVQFLRATRLQQVYGELPRLLIETVAMVGMMGIVLVMLLLGRPLHTVLPTLSLFAIAALRLMPSMNRIVNSAASVRYYTPAVVAIAADIAAAPVATPAPQPGTLSAPPIPLRDSIRLEHLTYRYEGALTDAIHDVTLEIPRGTSAAFVGSSGAGKTTLADIILGLLPPASGKVLIDGQDLPTVCRAWQKNVGYIPQTVYLSDDTLRRNVAFGVPDEEINEDDVWAALKAARLDDLAKDLPGQLGALVGERGVRLSGGQRQRIGIARALYHRPGVLVMDEATSALDQRTERDITDVLETFRGEKTIIVIAHRLSTVKRCDILFVMSDGRIVDSGTFEGLSAESETFQALTASI